MDLRPIKFLRTLIVCIGLGTPALAFQNTDSKKTIEKILFLGNSITLHSPAPDIGWTSNFGMAASSEEKDYVHVLLSRVEKETGVRPKSMIRNVAGFERAYETYDVARELEDAIKFHADLIIIALGENATEPATEPQQEAFRNAFENFIAKLRIDSGQRIIVRSSFWPNRTKDTLMQKAASNMKGEFVDLASFAGDASLEARSERKIEHAGVGAHPGDKGMQAIADAIYPSIEKILRK